MHIHKLKLVTFDVTDTLLAFRKSPGQYYADIAAKHGVICDSKKLTKNFKTHFKNLSKTHPNYGLSTGLGWENWWKQLIRKTIEDCNSTIDVKKLNSISYDLINAYETFSCWKHCNGALDLLSYLKHKGFTLGVISNFDPRLSATLENARIRHYFNFVITSYEAGFEKPNPNIFKVAMELSNINDLKSEECLHVGDSHSLDYEGAENAGWNAVLVSSNNEDFKVKYTFPSLFDFHRYIVDINGEKLFLKTKS